MLTHAVETAFRQMAEARIAVQRATDSKGLKIFLPSGEDVEELRATAQSLAARLSVQHITLTPAGVAADDRGLETTATHLALVADLLAKVAAYQRMTK